MKPERMLMHPRMGVIFRYSEGRNILTKEKTMNILLVIVIIVAIVLAITGGLVQALNWLLWVALVLAAIAIIVWLIRLISGRRV
jgi:hypothetical protein